MASPQVLHDVRRSGIRWRVTLRSDLPVPGLVEFEKQGRHGRLHQGIARWDPLLPAGEWGPRHRITGGAIPRCLVERIEARLRAWLVPFPAIQRE